MEIGDLIRRAAARFGTAPAVTCGDRTVSFIEFDQLTDRVGNALLDQGLAPGDRVGVLMPNGIDGLVAYYALAKAGLVRVSLNSRETRRDHEYKLGDTKCRAVIGDTPGLSGVEFDFGLDDLERFARHGSTEPCDVPRHHEDAYRIGFTGGTTGEPKGVTLSMRSEHAEVTNYLLDLVPGINEGDVMLHAAPVTHASGSFFLPHLIRGGHNVMMSSFDPGRFLENLERWNVARTFVVPTMLAMILEEQGIESVRTPALQQLCYGASAITPSLVERTEKVFGKVLTQTYGQSEAPMTITCLSPEDHDRVGSAGRAYSMVEVRIANDAGKFLPVGDSGEVVARGQILMSGYWNRPEATEKAIQNGWLHTGDIGRFDEDGFLYLLDRKNDMIISGGYNVYPREVEDCLSQHPAVREAAVIGLPDEKWGERVHAVVVTRSAVSEDELMQWTRDHLAGFKRPRSISFQDDLPVSAAGKVLRRALRDQYEQPATTAAERN